MGRKLRMRHPKTTQERREGQDGWCRPRRNYKNLIESRDEIWFFTQRTWKKHRKTQYK